MKDLSERRHLKCFSVTRRHGIAGPNMDGEGRVSHSMYFNVVKTEDNYIRVRYGSEASIE